MGAEEAKDVGEERFRELAAHIPDFVVLVDRELRYRWVNRLADGLTEEVVYASTVKDFVAPEDYAKLRDAVLRCFDTGEEGSYTAVAYGDGEVQYHYETRVVPAADAHGEPRVMLLTRNVSQRAQAELALQESERRFRELIESSPDYILGLNQERLISFINRIDPRMGREDVEGHHLTKFLVPGAVDEALAAITQAIERREPASFEAQHPLDPDRHFTTRVLPANGPGDIRALLIAEDTTKRFDADLALDLSRERLDRAMQSAQVGLYELDLGSGRLETWGPLRDVIWMTKAGDAIEMDMTRVHLADRSRLEAQMAALSGKGGALEAEYRITLADGRTRWLLNRASRIQRQGLASIIAGVLLDITEVRELQQRRSDLQAQLEQAQRLESVGLLAGGIAHDFNNILTVIQSCLGLIGRELPPDHAISPDLESISEASTRAADLTRQLLAFSRRSNLAVKAIDLVEVTQEVGKMAKRILPESIDCSFVMPSEPVVVMGDGQQLQQVVLNLCINARDAMGEGGKLRVSISQEEDEALLKVTDSGTGMSEDQKARIFEPFYTTKEVGKGTGLGLAMAHGLIQQHKGQIEVESELERGTTFTIRLPLCREPAPAAEVRPAPLALEGTGRILVAEDEATVRAVVTRLLSEAGYQVTSAVDGIDVLEKYDPAEFDLVLLDVVMPRLDGWKAYERLREVNPSVRVLFSSGYSATVMPRESSEVAVLSKPYTRAVLLSAIEKALGLSA